MRVGAVIAIALCPMTAAAQGVADFDLTTVDLQSAGLDEGFVIRDHAAHFASFRCPSCAGDHAHTIRISRATLPEWTGGSLQIPNQQDLDENCIAQLNVANFLGDVLESCESQIFDLPAPLTGVRATAIISAGALNAWRSYDVGAVIVHDSGVIQISASDDDLARANRNVMALLETLAQAVGATLEPAE